MKRHHGRYIILTLALAALLTGCWGSDKSTSLEVTTSGGVLATATPVGIDVCHNCHANTAVGGVGIFDAWASSRHGNWDNVLDAFDNLYHGTDPNTTSATCIACHDPNGDSVNLAMFIGAGSSATPRSVIGCEACHGGGSLHFGIGPIGGPTLGAYAVAATTGQSSQYNTCTQCHGETAPLEHSANNERLIHDTHHDNGARAVGSNIQGYVIRKAAGTACVDCHNPHTANLANSPNRQWKASRHGDFAGEGWKHYDWKAANRASCQRCHTTTGLINYLTNPSGYTPAGNVFAAVDNQSEMLYCYGCHTNYYGGLRDPGPITASYTGVTPEPVFPDIEGSNICMACHTGRENGQTIQASTANFDNLGFINSHYLTGGATLFTTSGYEYDNLSYANPAGFQHDLIGRPAAPGTGVNGPCVGCHMTSPNGAAGDVNYGKHRFLPVKEDVAGVITAITSANCVNCHNDVGQPALTPASLEAEKELALNALAALDNQLRVNGFYFANTYPYFFLSADNTASANGVRDWSPDNTTLTGKNNMGAAFNYNLLAHDPGFYTHNRSYVQRLIYDSIDWLDNGAFDESVQATLEDLSPAYDDALDYFGDTGRP